MTTFNHSQRKVLETYWTADNVEWLEAECALAAQASDKPLTVVGNDRREARRRAAKAVKAIQKAISEIETLHANPGVASDVVAGVTGRAGNLLPLLIKSRNAAWQLENTLEQLTATKAEERNSILIKRIAQKLSGDGIEVSDKQDGALYQVCGLAMDAIGTEPKDLRGTIRQVIKRL